MSNQAPGLEQLKTAGVRAELIAAWQRLMDELAALGSAVVAYSGGVDSTFLAWAVRQALGDRMLAVTVDNGLDPQAQILAAETQAQRLGIPQRTIKVDGLAVAGIRENQPDRCYHCKATLLGQIHALARTEGFAAVVEGQNLDDEGDYRPGRRAVRESGTHSPLAASGLTKADVRALSQTFGLPAWDMPSSPCLASRVPYGTPLDASLLGQIEQAEALLHSLGFRQVRVRHHGNLARIEVPAGEIPALLQHASAVSRAFRELGFLYTSVDLQGYRIGSMNEGLAR